MENEQAESQLNRFEKIQKAAHVEELWTESFAAEEGGDLQRALEVQKQIVSLEAFSYASVFRLAWLYYCSGDLHCALEYYQKAWDVSEGREWPLYGLRNCYHGLGDVQSMESVTQRIQMFNTAEGCCVDAIQPARPQQLTRSEKDCLLMT